ncbi:hypothetical protein ACFL2Y_01085 [Candidatus Omnitrophota bacterium]
MKRLSRIIVCILLVSVFVSSHCAYAQGTWRERIRERWKQRIEKKQETKEAQSGHSLFGLGGKDYRWQVTWITKKGDYGTGDYGRIIKHQGMNRFYKFHVPPGYKKNKPIPVVLVFHGGGGYPGAVRYQTDFDKIADKRGFIAVFPAGHHRIWKDRLLHWNDGRTPQNDPTFKDIDDVGFVAALLDDLMKFFKVDKSRIYATGLSNGALMTYRLGSELSDRIAAIAPVGGQRAIGEYGQKPPRPISVMHFHGKKDAWAKYDGGAPPKSFFKESLKPVEETIQTWISHNGCPSGPAKTKRIGKAVITHYSSGKNGSEVVLVTLEDGGHTWPGGKMTESEKDYLGIGTGPINQDISAMEMMWEFFKKHPMVGYIDEVGYETGPVEDDIGRIGKCGNNICEDDETNATCSEDCCSKIFQLHKDHEQGCINRGWNKKIVNVDGRPRKVLWKGPGKWKNGAIIALHGGGGAPSVWCYTNIPGAEAGAAFGDLAVNQGFAFFGLDSTYNAATDPEGRGIGKRFDCLEIEGRKNVDLPYIKKIITETIPQLRPNGSSQDIFITGISTGGYTTLLSATHFNDKITAFAPVAGGDPYGAYFDMSHPEKLGRDCTPGGMKDSETHKPINWKNAAKSESHPNEKKWPKTIKNIPFKQFHHELDCTCDISNMEKAREQLISHGYIEDENGPFRLTLDADPGHVKGYCIYNDPTRPGRRGVRGEQLCCIEDHFWQEQFSQPILDFFKKHSKK